MGKYLIYSWCKTGQKFIFYSFLFKFFNFVFLFAEMLLGFQRMEKILGRPVHFSTHQITVIMRAVCKASRNLMPPLIYAIERPSEIFCGPKRLKSPSFLPSPSSPNPKTLIWWRILDPNSTLLRTFTVLPKLSLILSQILIFEGFWVLWIKFFAHVMIELNSLFILAASFA